MNSEFQYNVVDQMERFGGSFVQALAAAMRCADPINFLKLVLAFPNYWMEYSAMVPTIKDLKDSDIGRVVNYKPNLENEFGKIKKFDNEKQTAWVVYKCGEDWDNFLNYTAAATSYSDLYFTDSGL